MNPRTNAQMTGRGVSLYFVVGVFVVVSIDAIRGFPAFNCAPAL
jgi:hypothetical protein